MIDNQASIPIQDSNSRLRKNSKNEQDETVLWQEFRNGDYNAFNLIYKRYIKSLYNFGSKISSDKSLVEDAIHDFFIDLWRNRSNLGDAYSLKFYLMKGLKRKLIKALVDNSKSFGSEILEEEYAFEIVFSHESFLISEQITKEQKLAMENALKELTDRQREALYLRYFEGLSYEEISSLMSISMKRAYNLVNISISSLRKRLLSDVMLLLITFLVS